MKKKLLELAEKHIDGKAFKEDVRKLGVNLMTAGIVGLFITHLAEITIWYILAAIWIIIVGTVFMVSGLFSRRR